MNKTQLTMQDLVKQAGDSLIPFREGDIVEAEILAKSQKRIFVDIGGLSLGMIPEKEFSSDINEFQKGDKVLAYVLLTENEDSLAVLSLKRADRERFQRNLAEKFRTGEPITVKVREANRGGLVVEYGSQEGFIPSSQLASSHYPRVGNNKEKILTKLRELIGQNLRVKIITYEPSARRIIFSEKEAGDRLLEEKLSQFKVNEIKSGIITGIVNFGLFVDIEGVEGLVHISEVSWSKVEDLNKLFKVGDKVKTKIISLENQRLSLSIKRLRPDPWIEAIKDYKVGQEIKGKVIKITPFGAFVEIAKDLNGLIHVSELFRAKDKEAKITRLEEMIEPGKEYEFEIISLEPETHKINLSLVETKKKSTTKTTKKTSMKLRKK